MIKVYGAEACPQCRGVQMYLEREGVDFEYFDVFKDEDAMNELEKMGLKTLPIVTRGDIVVRGFDAVEIKEVLIDGYK